MNRLSILCQIEQKENFNAPFSVSSNDEKNDPFWNEQLYSRSEINKAISQAREFLPSEYRGVFAEFLIKLEKAIVTPKEA